MRWPAGMLAQAELPIPRVLVTSELVSANKPSPQGYLLAADRLGVASSACIVLEDSEPGVRAAIAAGMDVVAISPNRDPRLMRLATGLVVRIADIKIATVPDGRYRVEW